MKKATKQIISTLLVVVMLVTSAPLSGFVGLELPKLGEIFAPKAAAAMSLSSYNVGDIIEYGSYPQTRVTDSGLISKLEAASGTWKSYGYMSGAGTSWTDGSAQPADYMQYRDVTVDGNRYRAVKFDTYRKYYTNYKSDTSTSYTYQATNGYYINTTYWFKFEPLDWRVLDPQLGLVMCEDIIDSQPYSNTVYYLNSNYWKDAAGTIYANNYAESSIRAWLNDDFYYTAFSSSEQGNITTATIDNKAYLSSYSQYDSATTSDKVFMLTYDDALNTDYGFNASDSNYDINRRAAGSDYAKCQGLYVYNGTSYNTADGRKTSHWWLRSAGYYSYSATSVDSSGYAYNYYLVDDTSIGVRPALILNPQSSVNLSTGGTTGESDTSYELMERRFDHNIDYFVKNLDSTTYDPELANILAVLSEAEYNEKNARTAYNKLGFDNYQHYDFKGTTNGVYSLGFKNSEYDGSMICLLTVRGSEPDLGCWLSNLDILIDYEGNHLGFVTVANNILDKLDTILKNTAYNKKDLKYVITGHSRGAAIANLIAYKLNKEGVSESNVYNYNFACPDVACRLLFGINNNIFNLCNRVDAVPYVPGALVSKLAYNGLSWGKYGRTYWFTEGEFNVLDPFATHSMKNTYLKFFDQRLIPSSWSSTFTDKFIDASREITGFIAKILCPVDVILKDRDGNTVVSVINNEVIYAEDASINVMVITKDDEKLLFIFGEANDFNIELVGTDEGEMTYSIEKYVLQNDEVIESKTFSNVNLEKGKQMYSPVSNAEKTDDIKLFVVKEENGETVITHTINTDGSESEYINECNHNYIPNVIKPTCTNEGYTIYTCSLCGDSYVGNQKKPTGHNNVGGKCSNCGYDFTKGCSCKCHSKGFTLFVWKIGNFFRKIFGKDKTCKCGVKH